MSKREDLAFKEWGEKLADEVDEGEKESLAAFLATPVAREVFRGTIGQAELYRRMNKIEEEKRELAEREAELADWWERESPKNAQLIAERDSLREQLESLGSGGPPPAEGTGVTLSKEDLSHIKAKLQQVETLDKILPAVLGDMGRIMKDSIKNNFDVDPNEVINVSLKSGVNPWQAYLGLTSEERQKREEAAREDERKKWFEEGRKSVSSYSPDHFQPSGPSTVDLLQESNKEGAPAAGRQERINSALQMLHEGNF